MSDVTLICPECQEEIVGPEKGPGSAAFKLGGHKRWKHGISGKGPGKAAKPAAPSLDDAVMPDEVIQAPTTGDAYVEQKPTDPKAEKKKDSGGLLGKLWSERSNKDNAAAPKTDERKPATPKRRASTAGFWGDLVGPVSAVSARAGYVPMARAMEWSSPVVGEIIEDATKGTLIDKGIQPFVRNSEKWQDLFDLLGFWGGIGMAMRNPAQAGTALEFSRKRLVNLLPRIASNIRKERAKEKAAVDALVELMPDIRELFPQAGPDDDPVGLLIQSLFAAPEGVTFEDANVS